MEKRSDILGFFHAFIGEWATIMSGGASVPLAVAALFVPEGKYRPIFFAFALACFFYAAYRVWVAERTKVIALDDQTNGRVAIARKKLQEYAAQFSSWSDKKIEKGDGAGVDEMERTINELYASAQVWIKENIGDAALAKFQSRSSYMPVHFYGAANDIHSNLLNHLRMLTQNLYCMIENESWLKPTN